MKQKKGFVKWIQSGKVNRRLCMIVFMFAPLALLFTFTYLPFAEMVQFSFYDMKYIGERTFVGLENCAGVFKGFLFFPYLVCGIGVGFIFKFFYTRGFVLDTVLQWCGFELDNLPYWLKDTNINNISLAATSVWRYMGQNMVLFIGAIMSVDSSLYEAAAIDVASGWQKFRYVIFPSIKTIIVLNMILSITGSLSAFEPPYVITKGEFGTGTYFVIMDKLAHASQKVGLASAMAVVLLIIILLVTFIQKAAFKYFFGEGEQEAIRTVRKRKKLAKKEQKELSVNLNREVSRNVSGKA